MSLKSFRSFWAKWSTPLLVALISIALLLYGLHQPAVHGRALEHSTASRHVAPVTTTQALAGDLAPFLDLVPSQDGTSLFVSAAGIKEPIGTLFVNVEGLGPGHEKNSWTMTYSDTVRAYVATAVGFTPQTGASGSLNITSTRGLDSGAVTFNRAYVLSSTIQNVSSIDNNLDLSIVSTDTLPTDTYIAIAPSYAPPGPVPTGHRLVGSTYSVRAAGALLTTDRPMSLWMHYNDALLRGADPHTLAVFAWDAYDEHWEELGGRLFQDKQYLSVTTSRFTAYALMATTTWRDDFDDLNGLDLSACENVTLGGTPEERTLELTDAPSDGMAVSRIITPTAAFAAWDTLTYTGTATPPTTTLTVDVLDVDGAEVLTDVSDGASLNVLNPAQHPALRLRVNLSSTTAGQSPSLGEWRLSWRVAEQKVYLPVVLR
jgi:hypothetical protein